MDEFAKRCLNELPKTPGATSIDRKEIPMRQLFNYPEVVITIFVSFVAVLVGILTWILIRKAIWVEELKEQGLLEPDLENQCPTCPDYRKDKITLETSCTYFQASLLPSSSGRAYKCKACSQKIQRFKKA